MGIIPVGQNAKTYCAIQCKYLSYLQIRVLVLVKPPKYLLAHLSHWLMVSYCVPWMSVVHRVVSTIALPQFPLILKRCKPHSHLRHPTKCDVINDVKLFLTVYRTIYCHNFVIFKKKISSRSELLSNNSLFGGQL